MKRVVLAVVGTAFVAVSASTMQAQSTPYLYKQAQLDQWPSWAYGWAAAPKPGEKAGPQAPAPYLPRPNEDLAEQLRMQTVPGSTAQYSLVQIRDGHNVIDWFPQDHPKMPNIAEHGPKALDAERGRGCASCHLPNGKGRPENANPAGQPVNYILQQMRDMRAGLRYTADPRKVNTPTMIALAKASTDEELLEAAQYFAAMPWTPWIRVVETDTIPESHLENGNMYVPVHGSTKTEPLGNRIVESPEDEHQANMLRNIRSGWVAYVPPGSIRRGRALVTDGLRKTVACATCHGTDLMGSGDFPGIAGRSPSYMMRQLWDMKMGTRNGLFADIMKPVIEKLTVDDMRDIVAYLASVPPPAAGPKPVTTARAAN
jgi:cytochrome c553